MSKKDIRPVSRKANIVVQDYAGEILIYDLTENKAFSLNETSALIWQLCAGDKTVSDIAANLSGKYNSPISEDFVWLALEQLKKDNLLENAEEVEADFGGLSRREVIRKVGVATLVVLPVISSLIAPTSIQAQSSVTCNPSNTCLCAPGTGNYCNTPFMNPGGIPQGQQNANPGVIVCGPTAPPQTTATCRCTGPFISANPPGPGTGATYLLGNCRVFPPATP